MVAVHGHGENITRDGRKYHNTYCWVFAFQEGSVRAITEYADTELIRSILGEPPRHR
jgi:ketosteroid isomerase-like protein